MFSRRDVAALAALLADAARSEILPRWRNLDDADVRAKTGPLDLVTVADEAAERVIEAGLRRLHPGCLVVGEEAAAADPGLLDGLGAADLAFVVDPIDGTANFAAGLPLFGTMAAALVRGEVVGAVIHDPVGGDSAMAVRGEGAWIEDPRARTRDLRVAAAVPVAEMTGAAAWRHTPEPLRSLLCRNLPRVASAFDLRCAAHQYRLAADGQCHYLLFHRLLPWDHAPGWLLHREAGGPAAPRDGSAYDPTRFGGGLLCAPDEPSWRALREALLAP